MAQVATMYSMPPPPFHSNQSSNVGYQQQSIQPLNFKPFQPPDGDYDGKRLRKSVMRKTVDYNSSVIQMLENRIWQRDERDRPALPPDICYASHMLPPPAYLTNPINAVVTKFVRSSTNKAKCPIFCLAWTPEGRRLVTGASSGEFTLWNGLTFNFETILQAHESSVRAMVWSNNDQWMVTGDTSGFVKYWQSNMNNVKMFQAHKDPVRGLSFSPSDLKLASGSDDGTVRIWDFYRCTEEKVLIGHGSDVKCVDWHPSKSLLASGSKDNQQPIKLWDPRSGTSLAQLHAHKSTVMDLKWNSNGVWLCSASRDHLLKLFDIRNFSTELQIFRGHKKEAASIAWHPQYEGLFASGGSDGSILFWHVGNDKEVGAIESAHDGIIWDLAWHPLGHILCSGSNDHSSKFWTRNRPGDKMRDKYNLNTLPPGVVGDDCVDIDDIPMAPSESASIATIPGMGPDDKVETESESKISETIIPGLEFDALNFEKMVKKTPYAKPIPKTFQAAWNAHSITDEIVEQTNSLTSWVVVKIGNLFQNIISDEPPVITEIGEELPAGSIPLSELKADAIAYCGFYIPLTKIPSDKIQDAFSLYEEEEAISEITSDPEFARRLMREKKELCNPSSNQGSTDSRSQTEQRKDLQRPPNDSPQKQPPFYHPIKQPLINTPPMIQMHQQQPLHPSDQQNTYNPNMRDKMRNNAPRDRYASQNFNNQMPHHHHPSSNDYYERRDTPPMNPPNFSHSRYPDCESPQNPMYHQKPSMPPGRRDFRSYENEGENYDWNQRDDDGRYEYDNDRNYSNRPRPDSRDEDYDNQYWEEDQNGDFNRGPNNARGGRPFKRTRLREPDNDYMRRDSNWQEDYDHDQRRGPPPSRRGNRGGGRGRSRGGSRGWSDNRGSGGGRRFRNNY